MAFAIKLFYNEKINNQITDVKELRTSDLDNAMEGIFDALGWKRDIFENLKKEAIKSTLRDRVHAQKASMLPQLTNCAFELSKDPNNTVESIEVTLQQEFPNFDLYEIRLIVKCNRFIQKELFTYKTSNGEYQSEISPKEKIAIFNRVHNAAKRELYSSKASFQTLNKYLSKTFGFTEEEINQKVYREIHVRLHENHPYEIPTTPEKIQKFCDSINPALREEVYKTLFGSKQTVTALAKIVGIIESMTEKEIASIDDLLVNGFKKEFFEDPEALSKVHKSIYATVEEDQDRALKHLEALGKEYLLASGQALNSLSRLISVMRTITELKETKPLDIGCLTKIEKKIANKLKGHEKFKELFELNYNATQSFNGKIDALEKKLDNLIKDFAREFIRGHVNEFDDLTSRECLVIMHNKYHLDFVTPEHLLSDNPNISSLMDSLSDQNALRISEFLNSAESQLIKLSDRTMIYDLLDSIDQFSELSQAEQLFLKKLFSLIEQNSLEKIFSNYSDINNDDNKAAFNECLPERPGCEKDLDLTIVKRLYHILYERIMHLKAIFKKPIDQAKEHMAEPAIVSSKS